jgi:hypothetical protein
MPVTVNTILLHWAEAGVWEEIFEGGNESEIVVPPQIMTSGA